MSHHSELITGPHFNGPAYSPEHDHKRLTGQIQRVHEAMQDEAWRTLEEIADITGDPPASVSAQLRHLRKPRFGGFTVEKQRRGEASDGLWEYRVTSSPPTTDPRAEWPDEWNNRTVRFNHEGKRLVGVVVSRTFNGFKGYEGSLPIPDYILTVRGRSGKTMNISTYDTHAIIS